MPADERVSKVINHLFREESGRMVAVLTRLFTFENFHTAEDIVQEALITAFNAWKIKGIPENPRAWLYAVAKRKAIDAIRKHQSDLHARAQFVQINNSEWSLAVSIKNIFEEGEIEDSQIRMIFACCHPAIPYEAQLALTLKTLCGLSVREIARNFLTSEETITKRLFRAREKIREENIPLDFPPAGQLADRLEAVLDTLYLLFNEGYNSSHPDKLIRTELCEEAMRLCLLLQGNKLTSNSSVNALLSLICLQASREDARLDEHGAIVLLRDQDRTKWNPQLITRGLQLLDQATTDQPVNAFYLEAAIAATHAVASKFEDTNWEQIYKLYELLWEKKPGPVVAINKAIALGFWQSPSLALAALQKIEDADNNYLYFSALGDFNCATGNVQDAILAYDRSLALASTEAERKLLIKKKAQLLTEPEALGS